VAIYCTRFKSEHLGLAFNFKVNPNSCDNPEHYEHYLMFNALTDRRIGKGVTHVLLEENDQSGEKAIIGFVTSRASSLISEYEDNIDGRSAIEITEIAISKEYERQGFGTYLLSSAIMIIDEMRSDYLGVEYVVACADTASIPFYEKSNFIPISKYHEIPREGWNKNCIPMVMKLKDIDEGK